MSYIKDSHDILFDFYVAVKSLMVYRATRTPTESLKEIQKLLVKTSEEIDNVLEKN